MEYISKKFTLDRGNKLELRLDSPLELPGNQWYCGLKEFSLEQRWSLANDEIIIHYQNGLKSIVKPGFYHSVAIVKPGFYHSVANIDNVLDEIFRPRTRKKRNVIDSITGGEDDEEEEQTQIYVVDDDEEEVSGKTREAPKEVKNTGEKEDKTVKPEKKEEVDKESKLQSTTKLEKADEAEKSKLKKEDKQAEKEAAKEKKKKTEVVLPQKPETKKEETPIPNTNGEPGRVKSLKEKIEADTQYFQKDLFVPKWNKRANPVHVQTYWWDAPAPTPPVPTIPPPKIPPLTEVSKPIPNVTAQSLPVLPTETSVPKEVAPSPEVPKTFDHTKGISGGEPLKSEAFIWDDEVDTDTESEEETTKPETESNKDNEKEGIPEDPKTEIEPFQFDDDSETEQIGVPEDTKKDADAPFQFDSEEKNGSKEDTTKTEDEPFHFDDSSDKEGITDEKESEAELPIADDEAVTIPPPTEAPEVLPTPTVSPTIGPTEIPDEVLVPTEIPTVIPVTEPPTLEPVTEPPKTEDPKEENINENFGYVDPFANDFTKSGFESIKFNKNYGNKYIVNFDSKFVKGIGLSSGFAKALGFPMSGLIQNNDIAVSNPTMETSISHICLSIKNILRPLIDETNAEIGTIPINDKDKAIYSYFQTPIWFKLETTRIDSLSIEFNDFFGNPIACDNAHGHFVLTLTNHKQ